MTYSDLQSLINNSYAEFTYDYVVRKRLGADVDFSNRELFFVKVIYKVLMNQVGDETLDYLTKIEIQDCIRLFNKVSGSTNPIEYE